MYTMFDAPSDRDYLEQFAEAVPDEPPEQTDPAQHDIYEERSTPNES